MRGLLGGLLELVAPRRCAGCDAEANIDGSVFCPSCASLLESYDGPEAVFEYGGPAAQAIQRFKYEGRSDLGGVLGSLMVSQARVWAGQVDAVVPVPLHWRRRRARGYDQAALLARPVARSLGVRAVLQGLRRSRNTPSQVDLSHAERVKNMRGAFVAHRLQRAARVLLVDDVRTTGATLRAATEALRAAGVSEVRVLVLAARVLAGAP